MLEERKKKRDEEDMQAVLASFKVDRQGNITKVKDIAFTSTSTDASTEVTPNVSDSSCGVTFEQVKSMLAKRDVYLVNWLSSIEWETANKPIPQSSVTSIAQSVRPVSGTGLTGSLRFFK
jgi:hypothetical protein